MKDQAQFNTYVKRMCSLRTLLRESGKIASSRPGMPMSGHITCPVCEGKVHYTHAQSGAVTMQGCECFTEGPYEEGHITVRREDLEEVAQQGGYKLSEHADKIIERTNANGGYCPCRPLQDVPCPCEFMPGEVEKDGHCHCNLFVKGDEPAEVLELEDTADFDVDKHVDQCIRLRRWLADEGHISHEVPKQDMQGHVKCHFCQGSVYYTQSAYNGHVTMNGCYCLSGHVYHE